MRFLHSILQRRSFLTFGSRTAALAGTAVGGASILQAQSAPAGGWQPAREEQDDWLDRIPGKHRMVFDTTTPEGFGYALLFAGNYYKANEDSYGLEDSDLAVVIVARHHATPFAFNDAMWKKYGVKISELASFVDPRTKQAPSTNLYNIPEVGLPNKGTSIDALIARGAQFAVCQMATQGLADPLAAAVGGDADNVFKELSANLVGNSHLVPAGIVAVNRAQERGYAFVNA
jgi:intracellular sulfur oxidation DsrE/DsrF family protein